MGFWIGEGGKNPGVFLKKGRKKFQNFKKYLFLWLPLVSVENCDVCRYEAAPKSARGAAVPDAAEARAAAVHPVAGIYIMQNTRGKNSVVKKNGTLGYKGKNE